MSILHAFAAGVLVGAAAALYLASIKPTEPAWRPEPVRPEHGHCLDCEGSCHVSQTGRCSRCGSGSVWIAGAVR